MIYATSGCFLFCHEGHKNLFGWLQRLSNKGDKIVIAVNTDEYLAKKKPGEENLPDCQSRAEGVLDVAKKVIDWQERSLQIYMEDDPIPRIRNKFPKEQIVWVVGDDYRHREFKEKDLADVLVFTPRIGVSSSSLLEQERKETYE